jgi:hypothetical protein
VGWRTKVFTSLFQDVRLRRPYYHCGGCRRGQLPWDQTLGLGNRGLTPGAARVVCVAAVKESFALVAERSLVELTGLRVSESTAERVAEETGQRVGQALQDRETFGPDKPWQWQRDANGRRCAYVSLDATGVPQQGPRGAKVEGRMAYVAMIYNRDSPHDDDRVAPHQARYLAGFYDLDALGLQLRRQAAQVGWDDAQQWIALTDGGSGLEPFMRKNFPLAQTILDFWHASEHLAELARALHPAADAAAQALTDSWCHHLKHEGGAALVTTLEGLDLTGRSDAVREVYRQELQYLRNNVHRMDYPAYQAHGWQIGSGPVESACKRVVNARLKGSGMRWGSDGADALCHLRALFLSEPGQWEAFWLAHPRQPQPQT